MTTGSALAWQSSPKDTLQAAISYNLARFVARTRAGTAVARGPIIFCVLKEHAISQEFQVMEAATSARQSVQLRMLTSVDGFFEGCDVSYLSPMDIPSVSLARLATAGSVSISDATGFIDAGGAIQLVQTGQRFSFSVNLAALKSAHKTMSSRVLKLAVEVRAGP